MRKLPIIIVFLISTVYYSQVGIGTNNPNPSANLELFSSSKGMLFPTYDLLDLEDSTSPVNNPKDGLIIYNIGTNYPKGYYAWIKNAWRKMFVRSDVNDFMSLLVTGIRNGDSNQPNWLNYAKQINNPIKNITTVVNQSRGQLNPDGETITLAPGKYKVLIVVDVVAPRLAGGSGDLTDSKNYCSMNTYIKDLAGNVLSPAIYNSQITQIFGKFGYTHYINLTQQTSFKIYMDASTDSNPDLTVRARAGLYIIIYQVKDALD